MTDEEYVFRQDAREKKIIGHSAAKRNRTGKGPVRMPSDYLTAKEKKAMNGEEKTYRLGAPMTYQEFRRMPEDLQRQYITGLLEKYDVTDRMIAEMLGISKETIRKVAARLRIGRGKGWSRAAVPDVAAWTAWIEDGAAQRPEEPAEAKIPVEPAEETEAERTAYVPKREKQHQVLSAEFTAYTTPDDLALLLRIMFGEKPRTYRVVAE